MLTHPASTVAAWKIGNDWGTAFENVCTRATAGPELGAFKRDQAFHRVLEHVSQEQGQKYLDLIRADRPELEAYFGKFIENDRLGEPPTFEYGEWRFSPTTLRYIKVLADLLGRFGTLDGLEIVEIGGGYGGQCKIIADVCRFRSYTLIDLPAPLALQARYLTELGVGGFQCRRPDELADRNYDLVISNFALSELDAGAQEHYFKKVVHRSLRGYLTWSSPHAPEVGKFPLGAKILDESPSTGDGNRVIVWGLESQIAITDDSACAQVA